MEVLSDETVRERTVRLRLSWHELHRLLAGSVCEGAGLSGATSVTVDIKQEERGSPSYRVAEWTAIATVKLPA